MKGWEMRLRPRAQQVMSGSRRGTGGPLQLFLMAASVGFGFLHLAPFIWMGPSGLAPPIDLGLNQQQQPLTAMKMQLGQHRRKRKQESGLKMVEEQPSLQKDPLPSPSSSAPSSSSDSTRLEGASPPRPERRVIKAPDDSTIPMEERGVLVCLRGGRTIHRQGDPGSIVYWRKWTNETETWRSPYAATAEEEGQEQRYITFEPDVSGFNNNRMALETFFVLALITGRTLVLPDDFKIDHIGKRSKRTHAFSDFFNLNKVRRYVKVVKMSEFLEREGLTGRLKNGAAPPDRATFLAEPAALWEYIRTAADVFPVGPSHVLGFEADLGKGFDPKADKEFQAFAGGRPLFVYDGAMHAKRVLHFTSMLEGGARYLVHFYGFVYLRNKTADHFVKRFVRDVLHYRPAIQCPAQGIVNLLRAESADAGSYDAIHIRRGDFQRPYPETGLDAETIFKNVEDVIAPGRLVYVVTNEPDPTFFDPVCDRYRLRFLTDFRAVLDQARISPEYYSGMIEQLVGSGAENFVGTYYSTFTAYTTRLRGYLGKNPGYYFNTQFKHELQDPNASFYAQPPFFTREWPAAYLGIDDDGA